MITWLQQELCQRYENEQVPWDDLWLGQAVMIACRSRCSRDRVGAVMVTDDNNVISIGYNGAPPTFAGDTKTRCMEWCPRAMHTPLNQPGNPGYQDCFSSHAELNCLKRAPKVERHVTTRMYVSRMPCYPCAKEIGSAYTTHNLRDVIVPSDYTVNSQYGDLDDSVSFLVKCGVKVRVV